jgi:UDP-3-O-[3-hydroxymyristoyl] glucosamine N-acyltransferase
VNNVVNKPRPKTLVRRIVNRILHTMARTLPGSRSIRPMLHRWRGVRIGRNVFIGDDVYLENEYPECIEIGENVEIALRTIVLAHLRGPGKVLIKRNAWIGACCLVSVVNDRTLTIGEGAVVGAGSIVTGSLPDRVFVRPEPPSPVATTSTPLAIAPSYLAFLRGLRPLRRTVHSNGKPQEHRTTLERGETS